MSPVERKKKVITPSAAVTDSSVVSAAFSAISGAAKISVSTRISASSTTSTTHGVRSLMRSIRSRPTAVAPPTTACEPYARRSEERRSRTIVSALELSE